MTVVLTNGLQLNHLVREGIVQQYPPLCDRPGSMTAQFVSVFIFVHFLVKGWCFRGISDAWTFRNIQFFCVRLERRLSVEGTTIDQVVVFLPNPLGAATL